MRSRESAAALVLVAALLAPGCRRDRGPEQPGLLLAEARAMLESSGFGPARQRAEAARAAAASRGDHAGVAESELLLAEVEESRGRLAEARLRRERLLAAARERGDDLLTARALTGLGLGAWREADYQRAAALCGEAVARAAAGHAPAVEGEAEVCLGRVEFKRGRYAAASAHFERARDAGARTGDAVVEALALEGLAFVALDRQRRADALELLTAARKRAADADRPGLSCRLLQETGVFYLVEGDSEDALATAAELRRVGELRGLPGAVADARFLEAQAWRGLGRADAALAAYADVAEARAALDDPRGRAWVLATAADLAAETGDWTRARSGYREAIGLWHGMNDRRAAGWYLLAVARAEERVSSVDRALAAYRQAVAEAASIDLPYLTEAQGSLARLLARQGQQDEAATLAERAVTGARAGGGLRLLWTALSDRAVVERSAGRGEAARLSLLEALEVIETERTAAPRTDRSKAAVFEEKQRVFAEAVDLLAALGRGGEALEVAERGRARAFLDLLGSTRDQETAGVGTAPSAGDVASPATVAPPRLGQLLSAVQRRNLTVVEYFVGPERTQVWTISGGKLTSASVEIGAVALATLAASARSGDAAALGELFSRLVAPVEDLLTGAKAATVVIVPHGPLLLVPFAALLDGEGRYWVERRALVEVPSLAALAALEPSRRQPATGGALVVCAPPPVGQPAGHALPALPEAEAEARAVAALSPGEVVTLLGQSASEERVRRLAPGRALLHLATHAVPRDDDPAASWLALAPGAVSSGDRVATRDDGRWTAGEILQSRLDIDLVVLSACDTGAGRVTGEGVLGLSRAFLAAGCRSVVVSLWRVADVVARFQMERFYRDLRRHGDRARALQTAQVETLQALRAGELTTLSGRPIPESPAYWAPFVLIGAPD